MSLINCKECGNEVSSKARSCPKCGAPIQAESSARPLRKWPILLFFTVFAIIIIGNITRRNEFSNTGTATAVDNLPQLTRKDIAKGNTSLEYKWKRTGGGIVLMIDCVVNNKSKHAVKDISIECEYLGQSGTTLGKSVGTIYDVVPSEEKRTFDNINMGFVPSQMARTYCQIQDLQLASP